MKSRLAVAAVVVAGACLLNPALSFSQCTLATNVTPPLTPDGSPTTASVPTEGARYLANLTAGRSYSLKIIVEQGYDGSAPTLTGTGPIFCASSPLTLTNTSSTQPEVFFSGAFTTSRGGIRVNFTIPSTGGYAFDFQHFAGGTATVTAVLVETTLFNPAWSTFGSFETFYSCINTTNSTLNATLTLFTIAGVQVASFPLNNVAAGSGVSTNTGPTALNVANGQNGFATLTHDGPPGAFMCEAAIANFTTPPGVIQPVKFEPARQQR